MIPRKTFLYFITESETGKSYFVDGNGQVQVDNEPTPLPQSPDGWLNNKVSFGRSMKYYGLNRTFSVPLKFVGDGAIIIRNVFWKTKGINSDLTLIILKWDDETDIYQMYYKGKLDLAKIDDSVSGSVTANVIEGGIPQKLKAFENLVYEVPLDGSIPENFKVKIDGYLFDVNYNFNMLENSNTSGGNDDLFIILPFYILNNDGIAFGIEFFNQVKQTVGVDIPQLDAYVENVSNFFANTNQVTQIVMSGELKIYCDENLPVNYGNYEIFVYTSLGNKYPIQVTVEPKRNTSYTIPVNLNITLQAGEKPFLVYRQNNNTDSSLTIDFLESTVNVKSKTRYVATTAWAINARDLFKILVSKISDGKYLSQSVLLESIPNIALTSGFALRQDPKGVLKTTISDFFESMNAILNGSMGGSDDVLFFEEKEYVYDNTFDNIELGEVAELKISVAEEYLFNSLKVGFEPQTYDEKIGQIEFNSAMIFKGPIDVIANKEFNLLSKYRADIVGIEFVRSNPFSLKSTTTNDSDNDVFILNIDLDNPVNDQFYGAQKAEEETGYTGDIDINFDTTEGVGFTPNADNSIFVYNRPFPANVKFSASAIFEDDESGDKLFKILLNGVSVFDVTVPANGVTPAGSPTLEFVMQLNDTLQFHVIEQGGASSYAVKNALFILTYPDINTYPVKRVVYDDIDGISNPETAYNIEELTPKRLFNKHSNWFRSVYHNLLDKFFTFQSHDKNPNLSTTLDGITVKENSDFPVSSMVEPLFYPYIFEFNTKVPLNFIDLLNASANGHVKFKYNGKDLFGFPLEVSAKPALNEAQEWKLLVSTKTNLLDLINLDVDGINFIDMDLYQTFIPFLCPLQFVPLGYVQPSQYHFKDMDSDLFIEQIKFWAAQKNYFQPWQNDEVIKIQIQTNGLGPAKVELLTCEGDIVQTDNLDIIVTDAIKDPKILYEGNINLAGLPEGLYYPLLTVGVGETVTQFIGEGIHVKEDWSMTLRFDYTNTRNKHSVVFSEGYTPSFRVHGWLDSYTPESKFAVYEDEPADIELLDGIAYDIFKLNIAIEDGVPDWVIRKINMIMLLNEVMIDGIYYTRNGDSKFEVVSIPGNPKKYWTIDVRKSNNRDGITLNTDGQLDFALTVQYNINTKGFGDGAKNDNIVQVTEID